MKNKNYHWFSICLLVLLTACQFEPRFTNHPQPNLAVNFDVFNDVGCPKDEYGFRYCNSDSPLAALGCDEIREPSNLIGGLTPSYPIAVCEVHLVPNKTKAEIKTEIENRQYFFDTGGMFSSYIRYVIHKNDKGVFHFS